MRRRSIPILGGGVTVLAGLVGLYGTVTDEFFTFFGEPAPIFLACTLLINGAAAIAVGASEKRRQAGWVYVALHALGGLGAAFLPNSMLLLFTERGLIGGLWVIGAVVSATSLAWPRIARGLGLESDALSGMQAQLVRLDGLRDAEMLTEPEYVERRGAVLASVELPAFESEDELLLALAPFKSGGFLSEDDISRLRGRHEAGSPPQAIRWWFWVGWGLTTLLSLYGLSRVA